MAIEVKAKKWGNSIGFVLPSEAVEKLNIRPEESVVVEITKKENVLKELFGAVKFSKSSKELVRETRKELEGKWLKQKSA